MVKDVFMRLKQSFPCHLAHIELRVHNNLLNTLHAHVSLIESVLLNMMQSANNETLRDSKIYVTLEAKP